MIKIPPKIHKIHGVLAKKPLEGIIVLKGRPIKKRVTTLVPFLGHPKKAQVLNGRDYLCCQEKNYSWSEGVYLRLAALAPTDCSLIKDLYKRFSVIVI